MHEKFLDDARTVLNQYDEGVITEEEAVFKLISNSHMYSHSLPAYEVELTRIELTVEFGVFIANESIYMRHVRDTDTTLRFHCMSHDAICRLIDTYWVDNSKPGKEIQAQRDTIYPLIEAVYNKEGY